MVYFLYIYEKYKFMFIAKKILMFILMFAILTVLYYIWLIVKGYITDTKLDTDWKDKLIVGSAISYILTIIFTGFQLF